MLGGLYRQVLLGNILVAGGEGGLYHPVRRLPGGQLGGIVPEEDPLEVQHDHLRGNRVVGDRDTVARRQVPFRGQVTVPAKIRRVRPPEQVLHLRGRGRTCQGGQGRLRESGRNSNGGGIGARGGPGGGGSARARGKRAGGCVSGGGRVGGCGGSCGGGRPGGGGSVAG